MKKNITTLLLAFVTLLVGCSREYVEPSSFSDVGWYTSNFTQQTFKIGIDDFISFTDVSQNTLTHTWEISEGNHFLEGVITRRDTVLEKFIKKDAGLVSSDPTVHVYFKKGGIQTVRLRNTFPDSVTFRGLDTLHSVKEGNVWVIDKTFMVDVYDTIVPQIEIRQDGVVRPLSKDTIFVEAGGKLEFVDLTTIGRPDTRRWTIGSISSTDSVASIAFNSLGVFNATFNSSRTGLNIPPDGDFIKIPNPIKVIKSSKPFVLTGAIRELENETIQVPFNGEFAAFSNKVNFVEVKVNGQAFKVQSVLANKTNLDIKLVEKIYRPDVITVSLLPGSGMKSVDEREVQPFSNQPVIMHDVNLLPASVYGFEGAGTGWVPYSTNTASYEFTTAKAASGSYSLKVDVTSGAGGFTSEKAPFSLKNGVTYVYSYKVWIDANSPAKSLNTWILPNWQQFWTSIANVKTGKWETITREIKYEGDPNGRYLYIHLPEAGSYYFDDFYLVEKEVRP
ncbi:carbohydrate binding domain-containing protein [Dyadobacter tibetensis]|uniref:carbohydrate binding domain-containing protein n=1 Tax=Dyadobacter tibetensis TaxID=1211851 RepID=UPI00046EE5F5|nr:carbohydrate binding domain-containing protein [Dyadobacter tibetensis]